MKSFRENKLNINGNVCVFPSLINFCIYLGHLACCRLKPTKSQALWGCCTMSASASFRFTHKIRFFYPGTAVRYCSSLFLLIALISLSLSVSMSFDIFGSGSPAGKECLSCPATVLAGRGDAGTAACCCWLCAGRAGSSRYRGDLIRNNPAMLK